MHFNAELFGNATMVLSAFYVLIMIEGFLFVCLFWGEFLPTVIVTICTFVE